MASCLFFQLAGPMAAWGTIAVGEDRGSAPYPSRSAVLGLLASALGIRRREEERQRELASGYRVAIILCDPGEFLRDYHTTQVPSSSDTRGWALTTRRDELEVVAWTQRTKGRAGEAILSFRDYRCDGRWIVAIQTTAEAPLSLDELRAALVRPRLCLYLGRKACPLSLPLQPQIIQAPSILEALRKARFTSADDLAGAKRWTGRRRQHVCSMYWEAGMDAGLEIQDTAERRDDPLSRRRWQFRPRLEHHAPLPEGVIPCS